MAEIMEVRATLEKKNLKVKVTAMEQQRKKRQVPLKNLFRVLYL